MKRIVYSKDSARTLMKIPANHRKTIRRKVEQYAETAGSLANQVKKLQGESGYRLRVGDWRVIFDEDRTSIVILAIGSRGSIYK
jgi:mRNA interferase RelE/StbE